MSTTPRDDISGLTDYLRKAAMALYLAIDQTIADELSPKIKEAATQLDSLLKERDALRLILSNCAIEIGNGAVMSPECSLEFMANLPAEIAAHAESLRARVKELEAERDALCKRNHQVTSIAVARLQRIAEAQSLFVRAEQERDEAYERAIRAVRDERLIDPVDSHDQTYNDALGHAEQAIRRLAGPEKEKKE